MYKKYFLFLLFLLPLLCYTQERVEILKDSLESEKNISVKVALALKIATEYFQSDDDEALFYLDYATDLSIKHNLVKELADSHFHTALFYIDKDVWDVALEYFLKAHQFYKTQPLSKTKMLVENGLGVVYFRLGEKEMALSIFQNFYKSAKEYSEEPNFTVRALNNLGGYYGDINPDSSLYYYKEGIRLIEDKKDNQIKAFLYTNIGQKYAQFHEDDSAKHYLRRALETVKDPEVHRLTRSWTQYEVAGFYYSRNLYDSTINYAQKSRITGKHEFNIDQLKVVELLYKSYRNKGEYQEAVNYFDTFRKIDDSLQITQTVINAKKIKLESDFKLREETLKLEKDGLRYRYFIIGLGLLALLLITLVFLMNYRYKLINSDIKNKMMEAQQERLNIELEFKSKELTSKTMMEIHRIQQIQAVLTELKAIKAKSQNKDTTLTISRIIQKLDFINKNTVWKEFLLSFNEVHTSFFKQLLQKHPDITPKERRLCALLRLNLTTKEIALLSGQSVKSIENARTRVRGKLLLTHSKIDLHQYLSRFN